MRELFSTTDGIGLSMLRQPMGASDFAVGRAYSYDDQPTGRTDPDLSDFSIRHDRAYILPRLREAYDLNRGITFMASPWSAPGWMKKGADPQGSMIKGSLRERYHQTYANYFAKFIKAYRRAGIPTDYVSMQNEPLYEPADYPGMGVLPDQAATFLGRYLGPTLAREGLADTQILGYDHNWDVTDYPEAMYASRSAEPIRARHRLALLRRRRSSRSRSRTTTIRTRRPSRPSAPAASGRARTGSSTRTSPSTRPWPR